MQQLPMNFKFLKRQYWLQTWPVILILIIIIGQLLSTIVIAFSETVNAVISIRGGFAGVGFFTSLFFFITGVSGFTVVCCNRDSKIFATYVLVQNVLSIIAACILIYFDVRIIKNPQECLWPSSLCLSFDSSDILLLPDQSIFFSDIPISKVTIAKIQLAIAVLMLCLCLLFVGAYIYTLYQVSSRLKQNQQGIVGQPSSRSALVYPYPQVI